jgi:hypothetical protein
VIPTRAGYHVSAGENPGTRRVPARTSGRSWRPTAAAGTAPSAARTRRPGRRAARRGRGGRDAARRAAGAR